MPIIYSFILLKYFVQNSNQDDAGRAFTGTSTYINK